jgi:hypothetical protein
MNTNFKPPIAFAYKINFRFLLVGDKPGARA